MDHTRFDALAKQFADSASRRGTLRLLAGGLLGAMLAQREFARAAQRPDGDQDGLFDDDEINVYGTKPDVFDSDGDGVGDGEEIYNRDQGLPGPKDPLVNENAAATCTGFGGPCAAQSNCCGYEQPGVQCCFDANGAGVCTDVAALGTFLCPAPGVPDTGCAVGMTNCGGFCTDLSIDHGNCGACGNRCSQLGPDYNCRTGTCTRTCAAGLTDCFGRCVDLQTDTENCGGCGDLCRASGEGQVFGCENGTCWRLQR